MAGTVSMPTMIIPGQKALPGTANRAAFGRTTWWACPKRPLTPIYFSPFVAPRSPLLQNDSALRSAQRILDGGRTAVAINASQWVPPRSCRVTHYYQQEMGSNNSQTSQNAFSTRPTASLAYSPYTSTKEKQDKLDLEWKRLGE